MSRLSFPLQMAISAVVLSGCASKKPLPQTLPMEPGLGACETTIDTPETTGNVRYVREGDMTRQLWDADGDGTIEVEVRQHFDDRGRVVEIERAAPSGEVLARIERQFDGLRLVSERGDVWQSDGTPGPDGTADWQHDLEWRDGVLVEERIDELDAEGLPGIDGEPEFVVTWRSEDGKRVSGERRHGDLVVAAYSLAWRGDQLRAVAVDLGADGTMDERTEYEWSGGRVTRVTTEGPRGERVVRHTYCDP